MSVLELLRAILGIVFFLLPGFVWSYVFFRQKELTFLERITLSFGLSISLTAIILFVLNKLLGTPINLGSICILLGTLTLFGSLLLLRSIKSFLSSLKVASNLGLWIKERLPKVSLGKGFEYLALAAVLGFVFLMAFIPHLGYVYPLHIDEWNHFTLSQALVNTQGINFTEPFFGETLVTDHPEIGFHLFLGQVKLLTGLPWIDIFCFFPGLIFATTALAAFTFGRRSGFGLEAAFFVALIPTTVRMLGPSFLVPVALGLFFLPIVLFLLHYFEVRRVKLVPLILFLSFLFLTHPPSAFAVSLAAIIYGAMRLFEGKRDSQRWLIAIQTWGCVFLSSLVALLRYPFEVIVRVEQVPQAKELPFGLILDALPKFGYLPLALFVIGIGLLSYQWGSRNRNLVILSCAYLLIIVLFQRFQLGVATVSERTWFYFLFAVAIIAGYATYEIRQQCSKYLNRFSLPTIPIAIAVVTILVVSSGIFAVPQRLNEPYYHLVDDNSYSEMIWIKENVGAAYQRALVDPRVAIAFTPVAGRFIYVGDAVFVYRRERLNEAMQFLENQASDTQWLREQEIDLVYTQLPVNNPDLIKLREHIYILPKELQP